ncbi:site-specific tyrosine recombinase XerC, partial [human gut metagenome]
SLPEEFDKIDITDVDIDFLKNVTLMDAYAFLSYCKNERNNDSAARARKVTSIRMFYKYLTVQRMFLRKTQCLSSKRLSSKNHSRNI